MENNNDRLDFFLNTSKNLTDEYYHIQKRVTEDPCTIGDQGEENYANIGMCRLANYYGKVNLSGAGKGSMRKWDASIYSEKIRQKWLRKTLVMDSLGWGSILN